MVPKRVRILTLFDPEKWLRRKSKAEMKQVEDADLSYPVILTPDGFLADGFHRSVKAHLMGRKTIMAVRLAKMPRPSRAK